MRWLGNLFRRKRAPDPEQWQVGDIAECINSLGWYLNGIPHPTGGPAFGESYRVTSVVEVPNSSVGPAIFLRFSAFTGKYLSTGFRKVQPRADVLEAGTATALADLRPAPSPRETEDA